MRNNREWTGPGVETKSEHGRAKIESHQAKGLCKKSPP